MVICGRKYRYISVYKIGNGFCARYKKGLFNGRVFLKVAGFSDLIYNYFKNIKQNKSLRLRQLSNVINVFPDLFGLRLYNKGAVKNLLIGFLQKKVYYHLNGWRGRF